MELYTKQLASLCTEGPATGKIRSSVEKKIKTFAKGDLEHATEMLSKLWGVANTDVNPPSSDTRYNVRMFQFTILKRCSGVLIFLESVSQSQRK